MEGPSLVIACEEFAPFLGKTVTRAAGSAAVPWGEIRRHKLESVSSWGKHLLLKIGKIHLRVHFLMFGSYRITNPRENRIPKMALCIGGQKIYFYSCAIRVLENSPLEIYDWSTDLMSARWSSAAALRKVRLRGSDKVCDVLMDQNIFSGLGNIIKNEVLFNLRMHPETKIKDLSPLRLKALVREARAYSLRFYRWKKAFVLKKHWLIFRKKNCPICGRKVKKMPTGNLQRISHYCSHCQLRQ